MKKTAKNIKIWLLVLVLLAAHIFFRSVAYADNEIEWRAFHSKTGDCAIAFPSQPTLVQQSLKVAEGQKLNYDVYLAPFEDKGLFMLLIATYPNPLSGGHEVAGLEGLLRGVVGHHPDNRLVFADLVTFSGHPAMNFLVQNATSYFRGHALMVGNKLYLVAMEGKKGALDEPSFKRFLESFALLKT